ncbi:NADH dehydrogenase [ubiquinone] 1 beta subcomplex subunit 2, mitochondrial [Anthophora quadrimaculata]
MILSRGATIFKCARNLNFNKPTIINIRQSSNGAKWCYRSIPPTDVPWLIITEICAGVMWWWVLWNFWHDSARVLGHFPYPRPVEWSDEELGIPPDD